MALFVRQLHSAVVCEWQQLSLAVLLGNTQFTRHPSYVVRGAMVTRVLRIVLEFLRSKLRFHIDLIGIAPSVQAFFYSVSRSNLVAVFLYGARARRYTRL
mmetsp:Transcript_113458/g.178466  ORF Transcript_113458/g.178466 Transcript_113458/m.178466 type:complete len:100 (-) Transcript_113458:40-339(-)